MNASGGVPDAGGPGVGGRFTAELSRRALAEICAELGLDDRDAEPIKLTVNAVYRLPREGAVVRIASSTALNHRVQKVVYVARWLAMHGVPAVRLLPGVPAPVAAGGRLATIWVDAQSSGLDPRSRPDPPTTSDLARVLRRLHALPPPEPPLPAWNPLDDVRRRLSDAEALADGDRRFLETLASRLEESLDGVRYVLPRVVVHGDAHVGNLIRSSDGEVVICDFDATCTGPAEWDLVPVAVGTLRFGRPRRLYDDLARGYGFDVTTWDGYEVLRTVRELKLVTSVVPILASSPTAAAEFQTRISSLRSGSGGERWTPYR